jgi:DNA-binding LacI/PurR family transcriptional regulator
MIQFSGMTQGAARKALEAAKAIRKAGYHLLASDVHWYEEGVREAWDVMLGARVEGLLLLTPSEWFSSQVLAEITESNLPTVSVSGVRFPSIPQVRADIHQGSYDLTMHLLQLGHRRLTMLTRRSSANEDESHSWPTLERVSGFQKAIQDFQERQPLDGAVVSDIVYEATPEDWSDPYRLGKLAMEQLLKQGALPAAVLCRDDNWAIGALSACAEAGVRVPEDMALTGFGNDLTGQYGLLPLTTVASPTTALVREAVRLLVERTQNRASVSGDELIKMPCELVVRESCGAPRKRQAGEE